MIPERLDAPLSPAQRKTILATQLEQWPRDLEGGKGNPFTSLCLHCYGRHAPPRDDICPHSPPKHPSKGRPQ